MIYHGLGKTGMNISRITYGGIVSTMNNSSGYAYGEGGQQASDEYVEYALQAGINYFDVAPSYGDAQEKLGNSIRGIRDRIFLACKTNRRDYDAAAKDLEMSMKLLHTDHFDVYQLHGLCSVEEVDRAFADDGVMRLVEEIRKSGTAKHVGITAHSEGAALKAMGQYDYDTLLFPINWQMNMAVGYGNRVLKQAQEKGMGLIGIKSMIERGFREGDDALRKRWPKSWCKPFDPNEQAELLLAAMRYSASLEPDTLVPAGDIEHFRFAVEHADDIWNGPIRADERALLEEHLKLVREDLFMPEANR